MANAVAVGDHLRSALASRFAGNAGVREIRGRGLMVGIELAYPCNELIEQALAEGLLINVTADTVIRLLPPLIFTRENADHLVDKLSALVLAFLARQSAAQPSTQPA